LHALVSCGTPLLEALEAVQRQVGEGAWCDALGDVRAQVEQGSTLASAMEGHPEYFDPICRCMIGVGESTGNLVDMLDRIAIITRKQMAVRNTIVGAMVYPCLLLGVSVSVLVLLLIFVIPRFGELFQSLAVPLPPTTAVLVAASEWLQAWWWAALAGTVIPLVGLKVWLSTAVGRRTIDTVALRLPQIGQVVRNFATARVARILGTLLESRVSVLEALHLTRQSLRNHHYVRLLAHAEEAVTQGQTLHSAFSESGLINPSVCEVIRNGEQSGQVGPLLTQMAGFLEEENEVIVRSLTSIIEPVILLLMGLLVGTVAISMFLPLFDLTSMTQGGAP
jgi:type II secretory pathway component PulF